MPRPRGHSRGSARASRRLTSWALGPGGDDIITWVRIGFTSSTVQILGTGVTPVIDNLTVVRLHGVLSYTLTVADGALSGYNLAAGIGIVSLDAFTAGVASVPDPFDDIDWPGWMWHQMFSIHAPFAVIAANDAGFQRELKIESKAMRKLRINEVLFMSVQAGETGAATVQVEAATRVLVKLP